MINISVNLASVYTYIHGTVAVTRSRNPRSWKSILCTLVDASAVVGHTDRDELNVGEGKSEEEKLESVAEVGMTWRVAHHEDAAGIVDQSALEVRSAGRVGDAENEANIHIKNK